MKIERENVDVRRFDTPEESASRHPSLLTVFFSTKKKFKSVVLNVLSVVLAPKLTKRERKFCSEIFEKREKS